MGSIYVICSRQCPNGDGIYTLLYALYKYSTSITNQPTNQPQGHLPTATPNASYQFLLASRRQATAPSWI